ncbi:hypothetical protein RHS04_02079 [Rhizoctonia solani]|uniref:Uncharacterized protein n=1 Tax=Rhizoctonia solani TaxID=456999 RepID=A0A8H7IH47_9AGAM|nr:hypothetical protein RHS04_02079 [Rhizoctonia solani]KAF8758336.1 hypothetical protein RHS01_02343 [Rhizoctonia solani]
MRTARYLLAYALTFEGIRHWAQIKAISYAKEPYDLRPPHRWGRDTSSTYSGTAVSINGEAGMMFTL